MAEARPHLFSESTVFLPGAHALYADKRNLIGLSDPAWLARIGVDGATRSLLAQGIPAPRLVRREDAGALWSARLYQGQTTNFRTPGGGFAPVVVVPAGPA
ncbi:MAG: hypothetical protein RBS40_05205 [Rhodocyclaceae bacterium]|jgi:hypothetical protein|nr:hypothetical protein [Rhodocyclaceae bacterium]